MKKSYKVSKILLIVFSIAFFNACTVNTQYLKCNYTPIPQRPIKAEYSDSASYLKAIFLYTYELESLKEYCIN